MHQVLEPIYEKIQELKLSEIWERASRELKQVRGESPLSKDIGRDMEEGCAPDAVLFYLRKASHEIISRAMCQRYKELTSTFETAAGEKIVYLNDKKHWTFKQFATKARELGL